MKDVVVQTENEHKKKLKEAKEAQIKEIVQDLLNSIEKTKDKIRKLSEEKKALETSLDDLKSGRLDKLAELLEKNPVAKEVIRVEIHKIIEKEYVPYPAPYVPYTPWTQPWKITYGWPEDNSKFYCGTDPMLLAGGQAGGYATSASFTAGEVKNAAIGTYCVGGGSVSIR